MNNAPLAGLLALSLSLSAWSSDLDSLRMRALEGDTQAAVELAKGYEAGSFVEASAQEAWYWYSVAADGGNSDAARHATRLATELGLDESTVTSADHLVVASLTPPPSGVPQFDASLIPKPRFTVVAGETVRDALARWCASAGWTLSWEAEVNYRMSVGIEFDGELRGAVRELMGQFASQARPLHATVYRNRVVRIQEGQG